VNVTDARLRRLRLSLNLNFADSTAAARGVGDRQDPRPVKNFSESRPAPASRFHEGIMIASDDGGSGTGFGFARSCALQALQPPARRSEHDHASSAGPVPQPAAEGAAVGRLRDADRRWICESCYEDFKLQFDWIIES